MANHMLSFAKVAIVAGQERVGQARMGLKKEGYRKCVLNSPALLAK